MLTEDPCNASRGQGTFQNCWFAHDPKRWVEFRRRYARELDSWKPVIEPVFEYLQEIHGTVTLLYAARDTEHNNAVVLRDYLRS